MINLERPPQNEERYEWSEWFFRLYEYVKGFFLPVYSTTDRGSAGNKGRIIFNDTETAIQYDDGSSWVTLAGSAFSASEITALQAIAAETPNYIRTSSSGSFSTSSSSFTDVTNLSTSFTVGSSDSEVEIGLVADNSNNLSYIGAQNSSIDNDVRINIRILRDGAEICNEEIRNQFEGNAIGVIRVPCGSIKFSEKPGAGTYTYKVQVKRISVNTLATFEYVKMWVKEVRR